MNELLEEVSQEQKASYLKLLPAAHIEEMSGSEPNIDAEVEVIEPRTIEPTADPRQQIDHIFDFFRKVQAEELLKWDLNHFTDKQLREVKQNLEHHPLGIFIFLVIPTKGSADGEGAKASTKDVTSKVLVALKEVNKNLTDLSMLPLYLGIEDMSPEAVKKRMSELGKELHLRPTAQRNEVDLLSRILFNLSHKLNNSQAVVAPEITPTTVPEQIQTPIPQSKIENPEISETTEEAKGIRLSLQDIVQVETITGMQPWVNQEREAAFANNRHIFEELYQADASRKPIQAWFKEWFNASLGLKVGKELTEADVSSLIYREVSSDEVNKVAGGEVVRPVFVFLDPRQYHAFIEKIGILSSSQAILLKFKFENDSKHPLAQTGLLISGGLDEANIGHEIHHSIDPHVPRDGYNRIIEETFALFQAHGKDLSHLTKILGYYYQQFTKKVPPEQKLSETQYNQVLELFIAHLQMLQTKFEPTELQRQLVQCQTLQEFMSL